MLRIIHKIKSSIEQRYTGSKPAAMQNYNLLEPVGQGQFGVRMAGQTFPRETLPQKTIVDIADSVQSSGQEGWEALLHKSHPDEREWGKASGK